MDFTAVMRKFAETFASPPALSAYRFRGSQTSATVNGYFVADGGLMTGTTFSASIATNEVKSLEDCYGAALPSDAVGLIYDLDNDLKFLTVDAGAEGFTEPAYADLDDAPTMAADVAKTLGKVS